MTTFYFKELSEQSGSLSEEESKHCFQVLRHQVGDEILILDGVGGKHYAKLKSVNKRDCQFDVDRVENQPKKSFYSHLAIAPTKSIDRMEWLIEKLVEIGVDEVSLLETDHSERRKVRLDRLEKKAISAMKQSGHAFLPKINDFQPFNDFMRTAIADSKFIAHVDQSHSYLGDYETEEKSVCILIGPEGDFSKEEVGTAIENGYRTASLGKNTLRTETAGLVACCLLNFKNGF